MNEKFCDFFPRLIFPSGISNFPRWFTVLHVSVSIYYYITGHWTTTTVVTERGN